MASDPAEWNWRRLLSALGSGGSPADEAMWAELLRRLRALATGIRGGMLFNAERDDAVAEVVAKLSDPRFLDRVVNSDSPGGYLYRMLLNAAHDQQRKVQRDLRRAEQYWAEPGTEPDILDLIIGEEELPGERRQVLVLRAAIRRLSRADRWLVRERFEKNRPIRDLAGEAGIPYATMASRIHRLREHLRQCLEESDE